MSEKLKVNLRVGAFLVLICFGASKCYDWAHNSVGNSNNSSSTQSSSVTHDCPHCHGSGQRINNVTGIFGSCSSCGGTGKVSQEQYDRLSK